MGGDGEEEGWAAGASGCLPARELVLKTGEEVLCGGLKSFLGDVGDGVGVGRGLLELQSGVLRDE